MKYYCDTSALASVYLEDEHSNKITGWLQKASLPIPLSSLAELELIGAIQQRLFRQQITIQEALKCQQNIQDDINQGIYKKVFFQGEEYLQALQLVHHYTASIGCRSLDVLHVASALLLKVPEFITCDARQQSLAKAVGLKVPMDFLS